LVQERYLLQKDVAPIVEAAGLHWDWTMNSTDREPQVSAANEKFQA